MKTNEIISFALVILIALIVVDLWAKRVADEQVKALASASNSSEQHHLVITGFAGGALIV